MSSSDESIASFIAVTGGDGATAAHYLSMAGGSLESAIGLFLELGAPPRCQRWHLRVALMAQLCRATGLRYGLR